MENLNTIEVNHISAAETHLFSNLILDYWSEKKELEGFTDYFLNDDGIEKAIQNRLTTNIDRKTLVDVLLRQYQAIGELENDSNKLVFDNIIKLQNPDSFTITTGHQLNIFGGPLYYMYKIVSVINYCKKLRESYPGYNFIPVFWLASEDHDFEEINHFGLFGKQYTWETTQNGPVGRMKTDGILPIIKELQDVIGKSPNGQFILDLFSRAYEASGNLSIATRKWVHHLFASYGLLLIDADDKQLKKLFVPTMRKEILEGNTFKLINEQNESLVSQGYAVHMHPREINLFYIDDNFRERIIVKDDLYFFGEKGGFTQQELIEMIETSPEHFSPNVAMRPIYQETILPNLCYIGGAGEIGYWFQLKKAFAYHRVFFPQLKVRNSALWIGGSIQKKITKLQLELKEYFLSPEIVKKDFVEKSDANSGLFDGIDSIDNSLENLKLASVDGNKNLQVLIGKWVAEKSKETKKLRQDLRKAIRDEQDQELKNIDQIIAHIFPSGTFQERIETFIPSYLNLGKDFIPTLMDHLDGQTTDIVVFKPQ